VKGSKDLFLRSYATDYRLVLVVENRVSVTGHFVIHVEQSD